MANKQTTPQMVGVQGSYVNTNGNPLIPQTNWKSPLRQLAQIGEQGVTLAKQYQDIKFDGYQAQYSIMANQMYHEMQDATDPTQIDEIQARYEQKFSQPLEDNIWGKSYLTSQYRKQWENTMKDNTLKIRLAMQHKFNAIETEKTLNSMAMAAASTGDINAMQSYFNSGMAIIDREQDMTVDVKNSAKKAYAKMLIESSFNLNPNIANSFVKANAASLVPYGIDPNEIAEKTDAYNRQKENENYIKEQRAKKKRLEAAQEKGATATLKFFQDGNYTAMDAAIAEVGEIHPVYALKMYKAAYPEDKETTAKNKFIDTLVDKIEQYDALPPNEEKQQLGLEIKNDIQSGRANKYISDTDVKYYNSRIGLSPDGKTSFTEQAKTLSSPALEELIANPSNEINSTQATALRNINKEYSGYNGKENYIIEQKGVVLPETIKSWGFSDKETAALIDKAQVERTNNGLKSAEYETIATAMMVGEELENAPEIISRLNAGERQDLIKLGQDIIKYEKEQRVEDYKRMAYQNLLSYGDVNNLYKNKKITHEDALALNEIISKNDVKTLETEMQRIIGNVLKTNNGKLHYETKQDLLNDLATLEVYYNDSNRSKRVENIKSIASLYDEVEGDFKNTLRNIYNKIDDAFSNKNVLMGGLDKITPVRIAQLKEAVFKKMYSDYKEGKKALDIEKEWDINTIESIWTNYAPTTEEISKSLSENVSLIKFVDESGEIINDNNIEVQEETPNTKEHSNDTSRLPTQFKEAIKGQVEKVTDWVALLMSKYDKKKNPPQKVEPMDIKLTLTGDKQQSTQAKEAVDNFIRRHNVD